MFVHRVLIADAFRPLLDERVHLAGHSFGASVALQLALEAPQLVRTLSLLEPGPLVGESAAPYRQVLRSVGRYRLDGAEVAVDEFLGARWPRYREHLDRALPGAFEQAVADAGARFESDLPGGLASRLGEQELRRVGQPALVLLGEGSLALHPRFGETFRLLLDWLPDAEGFLVRASMTRAARCRPAGSTSSGSSVCRPATVSTDAARADPVHTTTGGARP